MKKVIQITESDLHNMVCEAVRDTLVKRDRLFENTNDEFDFSVSYDLGKGRHRQEVFYKGKGVGFLITREINLFTPLVETYYIPDVEYGMQESNATLPGKNGWIEFKRFNNDVEALTYVKNNFEDIVFLYANGDWD